LAKGLNVAAPIVVAKEQIDDSVDKTVKADPAPTLAVATNLDLPANTVEEPKNELMGNKTGLDQEVKLLANQYPAIEKATQNQTSTELNIATTTINVISTQIITSIPQPAVDIPKEEGVTSTTELLKQDINLKTDNGNI